LQNALIEPFQAVKDLVHRNARSGIYEDVAAYSEHESVSPLALPEARFRVADAFTTTA